MSIRRGSGYSALDIEIIEEDEDEDNEDREERVADVPVARGRSLDFGKSLPNKLCFNPETMEDNRDTPSPEQQRFSSFFKLCYVACPPGTPGYVTALTRTRRER